MIPEIQALEIIEERFSIPGMMKSNTTPCIFDAFQKVTAYAIELVNNKDRTVLPQLLQTVDELYTHCRTTVRTAVENIFIYRLAGHLDLCAERKEVILLFPNRLAEIIYRHWNAPAI